MKTAASLYVKRLRKELGLTQEGLARILGITARAVANYEAGLRVPNAMIALRLALYSADPETRKELMRIARLSAAEVEAFAPIRLSTRH